MPTLEHDQLVFRFPETEPEAQFSIGFQRTLRIPDSSKVYPLPPGFGAFPLRHAEDFGTLLPPESAARGGVILPMWQAEAMWLDFSNSGPDHDLPFPVAIKVAAGKINAVTGESWRPGLERHPQDYLVSPEQPWLDGFAVQQGVVRQFVAMPLGDGYSAEEQLTGKGEWGGLQISVTPLRREVWQAKRAAWEARQRHPVMLEQRSMLMDACYSLAEPVAMGLGAGGRMRQSIYPDPFRPGDWDLTASERVFVTLLHARNWKTVTGEAAPNQPPTAREYAAAGLPWFDYYGKNQGALPGSSKLAGVQPIAALHQHLTGAALPHSADVANLVSIRLAPGPAGPRPVRTADW